MIAWIRNHKKLLILLFDALLVPLVMLCKPLSDYMLRTGEDCVWVKFGGKCVTCGGTHFVNSLLSGDFAAAFGYNQYLFFATLFLAVSLVLFNLYMLFDLPLALRALKLMYNIPVLILACVALILFLVLRNIPLWVAIFNYLQTFL